MKIIGIVGGVASGKSFVSGCLEKLGAVRLDADRIGHEVLREDSVKVAARSRWDAGIFTPEGEIDRSELAKLVFAKGDSGRRELSYLEQLTHPLIRERLESLLQAAREAGKPAVVVDAALLFESGWDKLCDSILFVGAPELLRLQRAEQRGWSESQWKLRESAQMPLAEKRAKADAFIDNGGNAKQTERQVRDYWDSLLSADLSE